jgi:hypothetical protein
MTVQYARTTAPHSLPAIEAARAVAIAKQLEYRRHLEGCWKAGRGLDCLNCRVLDREADAAWWQAERAAAGSGR